MFVCLREIRYALFLTSLERRAPKVFFGLKLFF